MIECIYDALTRAIKDSFKDVGVWEVPVVSGYKDGDFLVEMAEYESFPKPSGYLMHKVTFKIENNHIDSAYFINIIADLEEAVDIIELENGILLKAYINELKTENYKLKMKVTYSYYSTETENTTLMEVLSCE